MSPNFPEFDRKANKVLYYKKLIFRLVPLAIFTCLSYTGLHYYLGIFPMVYISLAVALGFGIVLISVGNALTFFGHMRAFALLAYTGFITQILYTGGIYSSSVPHLLFIPLIGLFYGRNNHIKLFLGITILTLIALIVMDFYGYPQRNWIPYNKSGIFDLYNYFFIIVVVLLLGFFFKYEIKVSHTRQKEAFNDLQDAYQQLESQDKLASIGQMTAGIAHEINNPVNYMKMGALGISKLIDQLNTFRKKRDANWQRVREIITGGDVKAMDELNEIVKDETEKDYQELFQDIREMVNSILVGADRTSEIVQSLKIFSRSGQEDLKPVKLGECIDMALVLLETSSEEKVKFEKELAQELPVIQGNFTQLFQVMMNLIANAIDAIPGEGLIRIRTVVEDGMIHCIISDTGSGIPESKLQTIFQPFYTTKEVGKGTGLGLSISKKIVEDHGGTINVMSKIGEGTTFHIKFPVDNEKPENGSK